MSGNTERVIDVVQINSNIILDCEFIKFRFEFYIFNLSDITTIMVIYENRYVPGYLSFFFENQGDNESL